MSISPVCRFMLHSNIHLYNISLKCVDILSHTVHEYANSTQTFGSICRNQLCAGSCGQCQCSVINKTLQYQNGFHSIIQLQVPFYQPQVPCSNLYPPSLPDFQDFPDITLVHGGGNLFSTFLTCLILFTFQVICSS